MVSVAVTEVSGDRRDRRVTEVMPTQVAVVGDHRSSWLKVTGRNGWRSQVVMVGGYTGSRW